MSKKPTVRICADCQHCTVQRQLLVLTVEKCAHPRAVDVVTGKAVWDARQLRTPGSRLCGPGGRLWAAKQGSEQADTVLRPSDAPRYWTDSVSLGRGELRVYPDKTQGLDPVPPEQVDGYGVGEYVADARGEFPSVSEWLRHVAPRRTQA